MRVVKATLGKKGSKSRTRWCLILSTIGIGAGLVLAIIIGITFYVTIPQNVPMQSTPEKVSMRGFQLLRYFFLNKFTNILELLKASIELCERGGDVLVKIRNGEDIGERSKGNDDLVTMGSTESYKRMINGFKLFFPTIHVVSEEYTDSPDNYTVAAPSLRNREVCSIRYVSTYFANPYVWNLRTFS